jgi:PiT family inorganic phosphate transporter
VSTKIATTVGAGIISPPTGGQGLTVVFAALLGAITWNLVTWYFGLPSSSSHALIGGLIGAALAATETVKWSGVLHKVLLPMVLSPLVGLVGGYLLMLAVLWTFRHAQVGRANRGFRLAQVGSAALMAFGHGTQDAQKTMGVIALALLTSGHISSFYVPFWVVLAAAAAISLGTYSGGWRIMRTIGRRIIHLTPAAGFAAQTTASGVMLGSAYIWAVPVSTTHVITSAVMGVGATRRLSAVRWGVAGNIVLAWVLTIPAAAAVAALAYLLTHAIVG